MRLGLAKHITLKHIEPIGRSAGALGRRGANEKRDTRVLKTSSKNLNLRGFMYVSSGTRVAVETGRSAVGKERRAGVTGRSGGGTTAKSYGAMRVR